MKTLAIRQPWVSLIAEGDKTIEVRSWRTDYRGPLLLVASGKPMVVPIEEEGVDYVLPAGIQVCIVDLVDVRPLQQNQLVAACLDDVPGFNVAGLYGWHLANVRQVEPTPHKGKLRIYDTPDSQIILAP